MRKLKFITPLCMALVSCAAEQSSTLESNLSSDGAALKTSAFPEGSLDPALLQRAKTLKLDVNDVSFLLPLASSPDAFQTQFPQLGSAAPPVGYLDKVRKFFDVEENFLLPNVVTGLQEKVGGFTDTIPNSLQPGLEFYRIVSFRVDDCASGINDGHGKASVETLKADRKGTQVVVSAAKNTITCVPQIRVVAQTDQFRDVGIHLIFSYVQNPETLQEAIAKNTVQPDTELFSSIVSDLRILKASSPIPTDGQPLSVHPGFRAGAQSAQFESLVKTFLSHYLELKYLTNVAFLSTNEFDGNDSWSMAGGDYSAARPEEFTLHPILAIKDTPLSIHFVVDDNLEPSNPSIKTVASGFGREGGRPIDGLVIDTRSVKNTPAILDPSKTSVLSTDCASCHRVTRLLGATLSAPEPRNKQNRALAKSLLASKDFYSPQKGITAIALSEDLQLDPEGVNFHNFGYFEEKPSISLRTVYESAEVAASLNRMLFGDTTGPGWDCGQKDFASNTAKSLNGKIKVGSLKDAFTGCKFLGNAGSPAPVLLNPR